MKIALYIEDGLEQLVLTPQSDHERSLLAKMDADDRSLEIHHGSFYECMAGFVRQRENSDSSTIIVLRKKEAA